MDDAEALTSSLDLASVLVDELAAFIESNPGHNNTIRTAKLKARLDLLYWVLHRVPDCMTPAQIDRLCVYLVGEKSLGDQERDLAFSKFAALTNPVVSCFSFRELWKYC